MSDYVSIERGWGTDITKIYKNYLSFTISFYFCGFYTLQ